MLRNLALLHYSKLLSDADALSFMQLCCFEGMLQACQLVRSKVFVQVLSECLAQDVQGAVGQ